MNPRDVPSSDRRLAIRCYDGATHRRPFHLVAVVDHAFQVQAASHPATSPNVLRVLCGCPSGAHDIDLERVRDATDRHAHLNRKAKYVDVRSVSS